MPKQQDQAEIAARIEEAVSEMTHADVARMRKKALYYMRGTTEQDAHALINEAIARTLAGAREWRADLPFLDHLSGAMKSIAHGMRNLKQNRFEILATDLVSADDESGEEFFVAASGQAPGVDEQLIDRLERESFEADIDEVKEHFKGNDHVELVLASIEDGIPPRVLQAEFNITKTEYESARKKLRRRADALFRGRRKA